MGETGTLECLRCSGGRNEGGKLVRLLYYYCLTSRLDCLDGRLQMCLGGAAIAPGFGAGRLPIKGSLVRSGIIDLIFGILESSRLRR